jgi:hypothetical protein
MQWILTLLDGLARGLGLYRNVTSIIRGDPVGTYLERIASGVEKISNNLYYAPNMEAVKNVGEGRQAYVRDTRVALKHLQRLQREIPGPLLATSITSTPLKLRQFLVADPSQVLDSITPLPEWKPHLNPNMVPVLFTLQSRYYVGWQLRGVLPILFNCELSTPDMLTDAPPSSDDSASPQEVRRFMARFRRHMQEFVATSISLLKDVYGNEIAYKLGMSHGWQFLLIGKNYAIKPNGLYIVFRLSTRLTKGSSSPYSVSLVSYSLGEMEGPAFHYLRDGNILYCQYHKGVFDGEVAYLDAFSGRRIYNRTYRDGTPRVESAGEMPPIFRGAIDQAIYFEGFDSSVDVTEDSLSFKDGYNFWGNCVSRKE